MFLVNNTWSGNSAHEGFHSGIIAPTQFEYQRRPHTATTTDGRSFAGTERVSLEGTQFIALAGSQCDTLCVPHRISVAAAHCVSLHDPLPLPGHAHTYIVGADGMCPPSRPAHLPTTQHTTLRSLLLSVDLLLSSDGVGSVVWNCCYAVGSQRESNGSAFSFAQQRLSVLQPHCRPHRRSLGGSQRGALAGSQRRTVAVAQRIPHHRAQPLSLEFSDDSGALGHALRVAVAVAGRRRARTEPTVDRDRTVDPDRRLCARVARLVRPRRAVQRRVPKGLRSWHRDHHGAQPRDFPCNGVREHRCVIALSTLP
jgi:hypothetical protein